MESSDSFPNFVNLRTAALRGTTPECDPVKFRPCLYITGVFTLIGVISVSVQLSTKYGKSDDVDGQVVTTAGPSTPKAKEGVLINGKGWKEAGKADSIYGYKSYLNRSLYKDNPDKEPTICMNRIDYKNEKGKFVDYLICPRQEDSDSKSYCCGKSDRQHCCSFLQVNKHWGGLVGGLAAFVVVSLIIVYQCRKKEKTCKTLEKCLCRMRTNKGEASQARETEASGSSVPEMTPSNHLLPNSGSNYSQPDVQFPNTEVWTRRELTTMSHTLHQLSEIVHLWNSRGNARNGPNAPLARGESDLESPPRYSMSLSPSTLSPDQPDTHSAPQPSAPSVPTIPDVTPTVTPPLPRLVPLSHREPPSDPLTPPPDYFATVRRSPLPSISNSPANSPEKKAKAPTEQDTDPPDYSSVMQS